MFLAATRLRKRFERRSAVAANPALLVRPWRDLDQLADEEWRGSHSVAEAVRVVPRHVTCLLSELRFHESLDRPTSPPYLTQHASYEGT